MLGTIAAQRMRPAAMSHGACLHVPVWQRMHSCMHASLHAAVWGVGAALLRPLRCIACAACAGVCTTSALSSCAQGHYGGQSLDNLCQSAGGNSAVCYCGYGFLGRGTSSCRPGGLAVSGLAVMPDS